MFRPTAALMLLLPAALAAQTTTGDPVIVPESVVPAVPQTSYAVQPQPEAAPVIDVDRIVVAGFPGYDTDGVAGLSPTEFATWMAQLFATAGVAQPGPDYFAAAFEQTDISKDGVIQSGELAQFLRGG